MDNTIYIITPCRNAESTLNETIASVMNQAGNFYIRYHVQDAMSIDGTLDILMNWKKLIESGTCPIACLGIEFSFASEADQGLYDGIKKAIDYLKIKEDNFMTWLNADDLLVPGAFSTIIEIGSTFPDIKWITGKECHLSANNSLIYNETEILYPNYFIAKGYAENRYWTFLQQEGTFWKVSLWNSVGGINPHFKYAGDFQLWLKFAHKELLWQFNGPLGIFRIKAGQLSENMEEYLKEIDTIIEFTDKEENWGRILDNAIVDDSDPMYNTTQIVYRNKYMKKVGKLAISNISYHSYYKKFFLGWTVINGLSHFEPYSDHDYPIVQWGIGKSTKLLTITKNARNATIIVNARSSITNSFTVYVNNIFINKFNIENIDIFYKFEANIQLIKGDNIIEIQYDKYIEFNDDPRQLAILYRELKVI